MKIEIKEKEINDIKQEYGLIDSYNDKNIIEDMVTFLQVNKKNKILLIMVLIIRIYNLI